MSSTRYAQAGSPLSHERYLSGPEFAELRGISGAAVSQRAALLESAEDRELIWFLQGLSSTPGALKQAAECVAAICPDGAKMPSEQNRDLEVQRNRLSRQAAIAARLRQVRGEDCCVSSVVEPKISISRRALESAEVLQFLEDFCINPKIRTSGQLVEAIKSYKVQFEEAARLDFVLTANGRRMWDGLDRVRKTGRILLVNGREGFGKTESAKAWCRCHLGQARFVSLKGIANKTSAFREIAKALGVACGPTRKAVEMQDRIEDVLERSKLLLLIDEAHHAFIQSERSAKGPELIDWVVTLQNQSVPIALVTTPHFFSHIQRSNLRVGWNWHQLKRRIRPYIELQPTPADDVELVARKLVPYASTQMLKFMLAYVKMAKRDLSGLTDLVEEARLRCQADKRQKITFEDLDRAASESLMPADATFLNLEKRIESARGRKVRTVVPEPVERNNFPTTNGAREVAPTLIN